MADSSWRMALTKEQRVTATRRMLPRAIYIGYNTDEVLPTVGPSANRMQMSRLHKHGTSPT